MYIEVAIVYSGPNETAQGRAGVRVRPGTGLFGPGCDGLLVRWVGLFPGLAEAQSNPRYRQGGTVYP